MTDELKGGNELQECDKVTNGMTNTNTESGLHKMSTTGLAVPPMQSKLKFKKAAHLQTSATMVSAFIHIPVHIAHD